MVLRVAAVDADGLTACGARDARMSSLDSKRRGRWTPSPNMAAVQHERGRRSSARADDVLDDVRDAEPAQDGHGRREQV